MGYMGSGKSFLAQELAQRLNWDLLQTDVEVERLMEMSIADAVRQKGELFFRKSERKVVEQLHLRNQLVVDLGGGTPCYYNNLEVVMENFFTVYLSASPSFLAGRLQKERQQRPLLDGVAEDELPEFVAKHLFERREFYERAHLKISAERLNTEEKITRILEAWKA